MIKILALNVFRGILRSSSKQGAINMVIINKYEEILSGKRPFNGECDNEALFMAYAQNKISNNERLDLNDAITTTDIRPIAKTFCNEGIKEFTVSCGGLHVLETLEQFGKFGFRVAGLIRVNSRFGYTIPAVLMRAE